MSIFTAVRKRKARGICETTRRAVYYFSNQRQRLKCPWSEVFQ